MAAAGCKIQVTGSRKENSKETGHRNQNQEVRTQDTGNRIQVAGYRIQAASLRSQDTRFRLQDAGDRTQTPKLRTWIFPRCKALRWFFCKIMVLKLKAL